MAIRRRPRPVEAVDRPIPFSEHNTKRRRAAAAATTSSSSPWSSMHEDLVSLIAERVLAVDLLDYVRFRAACRHWCSCTADPRGRGVVDRRFHPLMLPEGHGRLRGQVRFFNRETGAFVAARLPLLADHCVLDSPDGLLLLQRDADTAVRLLHPFTGDVCELPPLTSLIPQLDPLTDHRPLLDADEHKVQSFRRVSAAVSTAGTVTVLLALEHICCFAHASTGDRRWTLLSWSGNRVARTLGFHGSLYLSYWDDEESSILRLGPPPPLADNYGVEVELLPPRTIATVPSNLMILPQLVECDSEILVVAKLADLLSSEPAAPLASIGEHCLFFGMRSLAVSSRGLPSVAGNSIVLCDSMPRGHLMQYNIADDTVLPACDGTSSGAPRPARTALSTTSSPAATATSGTKA